MPPHSDFWTETALRRLRDGIARDEPRRQIAAALGCTRNAVIGKARRLGLSVPMERDESNVTRRRRLDRRNDLARIRNAKRKGMIMEPVKPTPRPDPPPERPAKFWRPTITAAPRRLAGSPVDIFGLTETTCRWPLWGDRPAPDEPKFYCGDPIAMPSVYCPRHRNAADGRKGR